MDFSADLLEQEVRNQNKTKQKKDDEILGNMSHRKMTLNLQRTHSEDFQSLFVYFRSMLSGLCFSNVFHVNKLNMIT